MEVLINFSQSKEDIILSHALNNVNPNDIFWIDVGANDPVNISVTLLFSIKGGRGINIEPQEMYRNRYDKLRSRDINLFVGISDKKGKLALHGSGDIATMTDEKTASLATTLVDVITLTEVYEKYVPKNQNVHFLKIDVEGFEEQCIHGLDLTRYKPWIILIECLATESSDSYESVLLKNGYRYVYYDGQNRYYVLMEKKDILEKFENMEAINDYYEIISLQDAAKYLSYEQSTSWKITAPLRKIALFLKKVRERKKYRDFLRERL